MGDANERMEIGMRIAERHKDNVLHLVRRTGVTLEQALDGCLVSLGAEIMSALGGHEIGSAPAPPRQGET